MNKLAKYEITYLDQTKSVELPLTAEEMLSLEQTLHVDAQQNKVSVKFLEGVALKRCSKEIKLAEINEVYLNIEKNGAIGASIPNFTLLSENYSFFDTEYESNVAYLSKQYDDYIEHTISHTAHEEILSFVDYYKA